MPVFFGVIAAPEDLLAEAIILAACTAPIVDIGGYRQPVGDAALAMIMNQLERGHPVPAGTRHPGHLLT
ncbi:hypothetical protein [Paracoccus aestuarii]|nr:hypothetical protein [Paracoccus aestuarii]WCR00122.1 hypothetical protein JHW48_05325 [Paracoccus aestuarii]